MAWPGCYVLFTYLMVHKVLTVSKVHPQLTPNIKTNIKPSVFEDMTKNKDRYNSQTFESSLNTRKGLDKKLRGYREQVTFNELWKSMQMLLFTDGNTVQVENYGEQDNQIMEIQNKRDLKLLNETIDSLNFHLYKRFLFSRDPSALNQEIPRGNVKQRRARQLNETIEPFEEPLQNITEQVARHGYKAKEYTTQTKDGYILTLHRIEKTSQREKGGKRIPVLLMHGLLLSSACWLGSKPGSGLAYLLADDGHDVWLGNVRGNHYSRAHAFLDPDSSSSYWQFSTDEHGKYDLSAMIDKVLNETGADKLNYIGYSQGGATYFIMCSELPHYCNKTNITIALAPSSRHLLTKSLAFRFLCEFCEINEKALFEAAIYEILPKNGLVQKFFNFLCRSSKVALQLCELIKDILDSHHAGSLTKESILSLASTFPSGTSVHNLARFSQTLRSRSLHKFDYGPENWQRYGTPEPPAYNLSAVTAPVVVIYGRNDGIVDLRDVKWLIQKLPNVIEAHEVEDPLWTHFDVVYSRYVRRVLYPKIKEYLN